MTMIARWTWNKANYNACFQSFNASIILHGTVPINERPHVRHPIALPRHYTYGIIHTFCKNISYEVRRSFRLLFSRFDSIRFAWHVTLQVYSALSSSKEQGSSRTGKKGGDDNDNSDDGNDQEKADDFWLPLPHLSVSVVLPTMKPSWRRCLPLPLAFWEQPFWRSTLAIKRMGIVTLQES